MKPQSAKNKGREFQKFVKAKIHEYFPKLEDDDIKPQSMGAPGEDLHLSPLARQLLPISIECKHHNKFAIYKVYDQAIENAKDYEPIAIIKQNRSKPLAVMDLDFFLELMRNNNGN